MHPGNSSTLAPGVGLTEVVLGGNPYPRFSREAQKWMFDECEYDKSVVDDEFMDEAMKVFALPKYIESVPKMEDQGLKPCCSLRSSRLKHETLQRLAQQGMGRANPDHLGH